MIRPRHPGALVLVAAISACSSTDLPAPSDGVAEGERRSATPNKEDAGDGDARVCEPRSFRDCHLNYVDEHGQRQCPLDSQICSRDGTEWLPCGTYTDEATDESQPRR